MLGRNFLRLAIGAALALWASAPAPAVDDVTKAMPWDAVAVVRVTGLGARWAQFANSAAFSRLLEAPVPDMAGGMRQLRDALAQVLPQTGFTFGEGLASIFGTDFVLAVFPDKSAVFVARSDNPERLRASVELYLNIQRDQGRLADERSEACESIDIRSCRMMDPNDAGAPGEPRSYALAEDLLLVSNDLPMLRRAVRTLRGKEPSLATSAEYIEARKCMRPGALATFYVDTDCLSKTKVFEDVAARVRKPAFRTLAVRLRQVLPGLEYAAGDLTVAPERLELVWNLFYNRFDLPAAEAALLPAAGAPLEIAGLVPPGAVFAAAHQVNKLALWQRLMAALREQNPDAAMRVASQATKVSAMLGAADFENGVLTQLGNQAAVIVTPGPAGDPPAVSVALELREGATIPVALRALAGTVATASASEAAKAGTPPKATVKHGAYRNTDYVTLELKEEKFGGKLNPTMFVTGKYMVISATPNAAREIFDASLTRRGLPDAGDETLLLDGSLDVARLRAVLTQFHEFMIGQGVKEGKAPERARTDIVTLEFLLSFVRRADFRRTAVPGRIRHTLSVAFE